MEKNGGVAIAIQADVTKSDDVKKLFTKSKEAFGEINILVNNAGTYKFEPIEMVTEKEFHNQFDTNVLSVLLTTQEAINYFEKNGGSIINISSVASVKATPMTSLYTATKSAVDGITRVLSKELGAKNIRINSILPGPTQTEGNPINTEMETFIIANTPLGRIGKTSDVSKLATFLASNDASWITGQKISISGGFD
nr:SDR family oxidoreductase [Flavivirga aquatica]